MKRYNLMDNVGRAKYVVNYHNGERKWQDGSDFFDIAIFHSKKKRDKFVNELEKQGYKECGIWS